MEKEEEPRYLHLLQPNRDLAANWAVDVAHELESYLTGLSLVSIPDEEGHESFNFAEAALLIQGSIQIYSRKVEYLYGLVLQALDFIANKKQEQRENSSIQANGKDADIVEDEEEDFLNLDDVPEETNIDIVDEQKESSCVTPAVRPPACLLVVEGDTVDISGEAGELALYQISTSSLHRDFLLLDPCDAKFVDEYWKDNAKSQGKGASGYSNLAEQRNHRGTGGTPLRDKDVDQAAGPSGTAQESLTALKSPGLTNVFASENCVDDWHDDDGGDGAWDDLLIGRSENNNDAGPHDRVDNGGAQNTHQDYDNTSQEEEIPDPWAPLNPHEPGTLPVVPYKRGRSSRRKKSKKSGESSLQPAVSELGKVWQALECLEREAWRASQSEEPPPYEKLRSSFVAKRTGLGAEWSSDKSDKGSDSEASRSDDDGFEGGDEPDSYQPDIMEDYGSQDPSQQTIPDMEHLHGHNPETEVSNKTYLEDLCQAQLDAVLKKHAESDKLTELANRVVSWNKKIERNLAIQDSHPPFDIHAYGERILEKLSSPSMEYEDLGSSDDQKPFTCVVAGLEKHEVARTFAALLQLVNNGNVSLDKGNGADSPECFTAEKPFSVKLLSCRRQHEEMLHYRAPSSKQKRNSARKKGKGVLLQVDEGENTAGGFNFSCGSQANFHASSPPTQLLAMGKSRRLSGGMGRLEEERERKGSLSKVSSSPKFNTPEGKRRRRRQSLKAVQVRLAG